MGHGNPFPRLTSSNVTRLHAEISSSSSSSSSDDNEDNDDDENYSFIPAVFNTPPTDHKPARPGDDLHPDELAYPNSSDWPDDNEIFTFITENLFSVPGKPESGAAFFTVQRRGEDITLPIRYRIPILWTAKYLSASLKLDLTNNEWDTYRLSILHVSESLAALLNAAKEGIPVQNPSLKERRWNFAGFDRMAVRYRHGSLIPTLYADSLRRMGRRSMRRGLLDSVNHLSRCCHADSLRVDWKRWALKGVHKFELTEAEIENGMTEESMRGGLVERDGAWIWDAALEPDLPKRLSRPESHPAPPQSQSIHVPIPQSWQNGIKVSNSYRKRKREESTELPPSPTLLPVSSASNELKPVSVNALRAQLLPTPISGTTQTQPLPESEILSTLLTQITSLQTLQSTTSAENRWLRDECRGVKRQVGRLRKYLADSPKSSSPQPQGTKWSRNPLGHLLHSPPPSPQGGEDLDLDIDMDLVYPDSPPIKTEDVSSSLPPPPTPTTPLIDEDILEIWTLPSASVSSGTNGTTTQQVSSNGVGRGDPRSRRKVFVAKAGGLRVIWGFGSLAFREENSKLLCRIVS